MESTESTVEHRIYLLGDEVLKTKCCEVSKEEILNSSTLAQQVSVAHEALDDFRKANGFGRAIAAPQLGFSLQFIALNLPDKGSLTMFNPLITQRSDDTFTMWDDCLSFPHLMVCVRRHVSIDVEYTDDNGESVRWENIDQALSELLQHEIDHLHGILSVDIACPPSNNAECPGVVDRKDWIENKSLYVSYVDDYCIPTD